MKWVDHWIGLPLCFVLGLGSVTFRRLFGTRKRTLSGSGILLVLKFFGMGSIVEASPLLIAMRNRYPDARLTFMTFKGNEGLIHRLGVFDTVRIIRTDSAWGFLRDVARQIFWLQTHRIEAVIDLEFFSKFSTLLSFVSRAPIRVGFHLNDFWRYSIITHPIYFNYFRHISDIYEQAGKRVDVSVDDKRLHRIEADDASKISVRSFLKESGWSEDEVLIGININSGDMSLERRWPLENWAWVVREILERHDHVRIALTGSPDEKAYVESFLERFESPWRQRLFSTAGAWSLMEFLAGLELFNGFVTNDSGPMHFAAMVDVPMVSLWGPGRPGLYAPMAKNNRNLYADYPCSPCLYMFTTREGMWCNHEGWCMQAIKQEAVLEAIENIPGIVRICSSE